MVAGWLEAKMRARALRSGAREVERFIAGLETMEAREVGALIAIAAVIRANLESEGVIPANLFAGDARPSAEELGTYQLRIDRLIRQFKRMGKPSDAAGAMIWLYSFRCLNVPELNRLGRWMWIELSRGFPHVAEALAAGERERAEPLPEQVWSDWRRIPPGLEPD